jgi:hypothetical protein
MTTSELRFRAPGLNFYVGGFGISVLGLVLVAVGVIDVVFDPWNWAGVIYLLGGIWTTVLGAGLTLLVWFLFIWGTITNWQRWGQFRLPAVVIDDAGVRYLVARGPVLIPWLDIEQICLDRTIIRDNRIVTKVSLRLAPDAALLRDGVHTVNSNRYLNIGTASNLSVRENVAVRFLAEHVGSRLEITEVDRRPVTDDGRSRR